MALTETQLVNMALGRIGASQLTDIDADSSDEATQCNLYLDTTRDALLRSHTWRFASKWVELVIDAEADSGTSTDDTNTTLKLYDTGQTWTPDAYNGYYLWITGGTGENQIRLIADTAATYITVSVAFTTTPDDTSTYEVWANYPPYPWAEQFALPTDLLRLSRTHPCNALYELDNGLMKTNETAMAINYVKQVTDPDDFDPLFVEALVLSLAIKLCMPLRKDKVMTKKLEEELPGVIARARLVNLRDYKIRPTEPTWNESRSI